MDATTIRTAYTNALISITTNRDAITMPDELVAILTTLGVEHPRDAATSLLGHAVRYVDHKAANRPVEQAFHGARLYTEAERIAEQITDHLAAKV